MYYEKNLSNGDAVLIISDQWVASMHMIDAEDVTVQLANKGEADKLILEFEDQDGELCHEEGSIMGKYPQFHPFRP